MKGVLEVNQGVQSALVFLEPLIQFPHSVANVAGITAREEADTEAQGTQLTTITKI